MGLLSFLFPPKWKPIYQFGDMLVCKSAELEKYMKRPSPTIRCDVLDRDKQTLKNYYKVVTIELTDHRNKPLEFYVHESNILNKIERV